MGYTLTQEERIVLSQLQKDLIQLKDDLITWMVGVLNYIIRSIRQFILSLDEFKLRHIQQHGLGEILYQRALRFFKLDESREKKTQNPTKKRTKKRFTMKKSFQIIKTLLKKGIGFMILVVLNPFKQKNTTRNVYKDKYS
jgi:hypothetical protein